MSQVARSSPDSLSWVAVCRDEVSKQIAGFRQEWFGRMHRIDKFFHRVKPPPGAEMSTHKGATPVPPAPSFSADFYTLDTDTPCSLIDSTEACAR